MVGLQTKLAREGGGRGEGGGKEGGGRGEGGGRVGGRERKGRNPSSLFASQPTLCHSVPCRHLGSRNRRF